MNRYILLSFLLLGAIIPAAGYLSAQRADTFRPLAGTLTDGMTGEAIPGAAVTLHTVDSAGRTGEAADRAVSTAGGEFHLSAPIRDRLVLHVASLGYRETQITVLPTDSLIRVRLYPLPPDEESATVVSVGAVRRSRSVEDGCCRVESIREEVQQHAPFSPSPVESLRRYSSCTSGRVINAIDGAGTISLRGLEPTRVGLMLDDVPVFTGLSRFYGLAIIPSHALQTISISEGASDARYGNGVISGVVNLQTRPPTEEPEFNGSISLAGESAEPDRIDLNAGFTGMPGGIGLAVFGSYNRHNSLVPDIGGTLDRDYERASAVVKGNVLLDNLTEMTVTLLGGTERREGIVTARGENDYRQSLRLNRADGIVRLSRLLGETGELIGIGGISRVGASGEFGTSALDAVQTIGYGEARMTGIAGDHSYAVGLQGRSDVLSEKEGRPDSPLGYNVSVLSLYAQDALALGEKWTVLGAARLDRHSSAGTALSPRGSIRFAPSQEVTMRLMAGGGIKGESLFDEEYGILAGTYRRVPNRALGFERSRTLNYDVSWNFLFGESAGINTNLNVYYTHITGRHTPQPDSLARGIFYTINADEPARLTGMEFQARGTIGTQWSWSTAMALINYTITNGAGEREQAPLAPRLNLDASVTYRNEGAGIIAEIWGSRIGAQRLPAVIEGIGETAVYIVLNGRIEKAFGPVALFGGIQNGLNERQTELMPLVLRTGEIPNGGMAWGLAEGREFFAGLRVRM